MHCSRTVLALGLALAATALGCRSTGSGVALDGAPIDVAGDLDSPWAYLGPRYDANGDGAITQKEYDREQGRFDRLDRDGDGRITPADFEAYHDPFAGLALTPEERRQRDAQVVIAASFQADADPGLLRDELRSSFDAGDANGDGRLGPGELRQAAASSADTDGGWQASRMLERLGITDPHAALLDVLYGDGDGGLTLAALLDYFDGLDTDGDGAWSLAGATQAAPAVGTVAPDFTLSRLDTGDAVTLSGFAGKRPVALIFGSYT
jgi:Ca2+-binding EF-hand superfamily protein